MVVILVWLDNDPETAGFCGEVRTSLEIVLHRP
jgi:hypothetical protein